MTQHSCPNCGGAHRAGARFCIHCGQPLPPEATLRDKTMVARGGRGRLLVVGMLVVAAFFIAAQLRSTPPPPRPRPTPTYAFAVDPTRPPRPTKTPKPSARPTPTQAAMGGVPSELVGQWAYSDDNGSWLYIFNGDGSYEHIFQSGMNLSGCTISIKRAEEGLALLDDSNLLLQVQSGTKTTTDSCDSSKDATRDLAGTTETMVLRADFDGDRIVVLYIDKQPFRPYALNS
jgi:hypothetical protein